MDTGDCTVMFLAALMLFWLVHSLRHSFECTNMASYLCDMKAARFRMKQAPIWAVIKAEIVQPCLTDIKDTEVTLVDLGSCQSFGLPIQLCCAYS